MTIHIIKENLIKYTQRVCRDIGIEMKSFYGSKKIDLPFNKNTNEQIVFVPKKLLRDLPVAFSWEQVDVVCKENEQLRNKLNNKIGESWKKATSSRVTKNEFKKTLLSNPDAFKDLISQYRNKLKNAYDFEVDPSGQVIWAKLSESVPDEFPLDFKDLLPVTNKNILIVARLICNQFSQLIETNGWYEYFHVDGKKIRNERFAQKLFYGIADAYCLANNINLSRESNAGSGALDFKLSKGYKDVVTIEVKYSSNSHLVKGYTTQLPIYNKSERSKYSIYLILRTTDSDKSINQVLKLNKQSKEKGEKVPEVIVIDARPQKSASHM